MCLGALVHAGVPLEYLTDQLGRLGIATEYQLRAEFVHRNGQQATKVYVNLLPEQASKQTAETADPGFHFHNHSDHDPHDHPADHGHDANAHSHHAHSHQEHRHPLNLPSHSRHLPEIAQLITAAHLPQRVADWSLAVFRRLAEAEGAVHGIAPEQVHFHEVGATDAIVDIVGTCLGLDWLGIERLYCSALPIGGGTVWAAHGRLPVPPPAVLKLWEMRQIPVYSNGIDKELVTPTGAALVTTLASQFGPPPPLILKKVGLGAGSQDLAIPNILRLWIGEEAGEQQASAPDRATHQSKQRFSTQEIVTVLETQIDDLNPQAIGYVMTELLAAGALDVFTQAIGMKKSRPGVLLTVICRPAQINDCERILFRETTTLGIRHSQQQRTVLERSLEMVKTPYGAVQVKVARGVEGTITNVQPEYEDCARLARQHHLAWRDMHQVALQTWLEQHSVQHLAH
jgi:uncharacterized protein (TIGR00299 family) protein